MATTKKTTTKPKATAKAKATTGNIKLLAAKPSTRRPPNNPDMPQATIEATNDMLNLIKTRLDEYAQHLRALDRRRLNGVGVKKLGFIE